MLGHLNPQQLPSIMANDQEGKQPFKRHRRNNAQIDRCNCMGVALVGSNGAGKTTLLRTISRLLATTSGSVTLAGRDLARLGSHDVVAPAWPTFPKRVSSFP
jgi:ABC-type branched-subunit amino acid transport system ATPase component